MQLFYNKDIDSANNEFTFDKIESKHIIRVLRKTTNDILHITNGNNQLFTAKILIPNDKKCLVEITNVEDIENTRNYSLHIAIAPTKNIDRIEYFLEKATEIGIDEITPIICKHSERKVIKEDRLEKVLISAMKQSLKYKLPKLNPITTFNNFIKNSPEGNLYIAHCEETERKSLKSQIKKDSKNTILIGPEGDFSTHEIQLAIENNFSPVALGKSRLRTETAGLVATHSFAFSNE